MDGDKPFLRRKLHYRVQYLSWICKFTNKDTASCIFIMELLILRFPEDSALRKESIMFV